MSSKFEQALRKVQQDYEKGVYTGYLNPIKYEDEIRDELKDLVGKPIYRAVRLNHENMLDRKNIGIYWTWDKDRAVTYRGHEGDIVVSLEAKATEDNIDWVATIEQWMKPQYNGECEVRLKPKSNIDVSNVWVNKIKKPKAFRAVAYEETTAMNDELQRFIDEAGGLYYSYKYLMSSDADDKWEQQQEWDADDGNIQTREEWAKSEEEFHLTSGDPSMCFNEAQKFDPNEWLIHFTDSNPLEIIKSGFKGRSVDVIGLTTYYKAGTNQGDLALAFAIKDVPHAERHGVFGKYGENAILFKARESARAYHWGDEEYQVVFVANSAHNMHPIFSEDGQLTLTNLRGENIAMVDRDHSGLSELVKLVSSKKKAG